ncbi:MAG: hypothetical protein HYV32_06745 [Candidatus Kerfeldbacteria bacterium]|nr:hypothetical protein [Candidatus Kerfeldbacteria bacterium]
MQKKIGGITYFLFVTALVGMGTFMGMGLGVPQGQAVSIAPENLPSNAEVTNADTSGDSFFPTVVVKNAEAATNDNDDDTDEQTLGGLYFAAGNTLALNKKTESDAFMSGNTLNIDATVGGDLFAAGNTITVNKNINGSLRLAANTIEVNSHVAGNALLFANTVYINDGAVIDGHVNIFASEIIVAGVVKGKSSFAGETIEVRGTLKGKARLSGASVSIGATAVLESGVSIASARVSVDESATGTDHITYDQYDNQAKKIKYAGDINNFVGYYFFFLIFGIIFIALRPQVAQRIATTMHTEPGRTWKVGALVFFFTPLVAIVLLFTLVGIPFSLILMLAYALFFLFANLFTGLVVGQFIVNKERFRTKKKQLLMCFIVGFFVVVILQHIPWIGWIFSILASIWGMGGVLVDRKKTKHETSVKTVAAQPALAATAKPKKKKKSAPRKKKIANA